MHVLHNHPGIMAVQAFKYANLSAVEVLWYLTAVILVIVLPLSLIVDGTDWRGQFEGMDRHDWAALLFSAFVAHIGSVLGIQCERLVHLCLCPADLVVVFQVRNWFTLQLNHHLWVLFGARACASVLPLRCCDAGVLTCHRHIQHICHQQLDLHHHHYCVPLRCTCIPCLAASSHAIFSGGHTALVLLVLCQPSTAAAISGDEPLPCSLQVCKERSHFKTRAVIC